jgi:hypothetical protein
MSVVVGKLVVVVVVVAVAAAAIVDLPVLVSVVLSV